jgi:parallel beta-helix repeat protein
MFAILVVISTIDFSYATNVEKEYKHDEVLVKFVCKEDKTKLEKSEKNRILSEKKCGHIKKEFKGASDWVVVKLPEDKKVEDAIKDLSKSKQILLVEPNYKIYLSSTYPNDPMFGDLWGLENDEWEYQDDYGQTQYGKYDADIDAPEAWDIHNDASNIIVAVIDTGVNYAHPDLYANMWVNQAELVGDPNSDDDGNGYIDDIYGYDFGGYDLNDQDSDPNDPDGHGTHVSGTIGAVSNNNIGISGVCWNTKIMALKIFPPYYVSEWVAFVDNAVEAIEYAVDNDAKIINASWSISGNYSQALKDAIEDAGDNDVLFVAAAGNYHPSWPYLDNDAVSIYPTSYDLDNIISVLATDPKDEITWWSHYGATSVDLGAPGENILSTIPGNSYDYYSGTSMAAPHVSGACALVWSMYPDLTAAHIKQAIVDSADHLDSLEDLCVSEGRLNLYQALLHAHPLGLEIQDNIADPEGCVIPSDEITFTINYSNPSPTNPSDPNYFGPAYDAEIHFPLPDAIDPNINHPNYSLFEGSYVWNVGTLNPGDSNSITITLTVNENAEPLGEITSKVKMYSSIGYGEDTEETRVCCWGGDRIYVSAYATGSKTGVSWSNAYTDLQDALQRAEKGCGTEEIWVAQGIYRPTKTRNQNASFDMIDGLKLYGGFGTDANSLGDRNFVRYKTYLSGNIDTEGDLDSFIVVNTEPASAITSDTVLDGFIVTHSAEAGIYCNEADLKIQNCFVTDNDANGINIYKSDPYIYDSIITDNAFVGVYDCNESHPTIEGSIISANGGNGISCRKNAALTLKNSWVHNNGGDGIGLTDAASGSVIRNNTIVYNQRKGISAESGTSPTVKNCIAWGNDGGDISGCSPTYSCFDGGTGTNIDNDPNFVGNDPNTFNYHLRFGSPCRNSGDGTYSGEYDIDGEPREYGSEIDMGADEIYCTDGNLDDDDVFKSSDWDSDGLVNLHEYNYFAEAWLSHDPNDPAVKDPNNPVNDPNDPAYIDPNRLEGWYEWKYICNLDDTPETNTEYEIDLADLEIFWSDWCWKACYVNFDTWMHTFGLVDGDTDEMYESQTSSATVLNTQKKPAPVVEEQAVVVEEKSIQEQILDLESAIKFLEEIWMEDDGIQQEIDPDAWQKFMDSVYQSLLDLQSQEQAEQ